MRVNGRGTLALNKDLFFVIGFMGLNSGFHVEALTFATFIFSSEMHNKMSFA